MASLIFVEGPEKDRVVELSDAAEIVIGRGPKCDIRLSDEEASRRHCRILCREGKYFIADAESKNGTFVNGRPVAEVELQDNDVIEVGNSHMRFVVGPDEQEATAVHVEKEEKKDPLIGRVLAEYRIERRLRKGKFSIHYLAVHQQTGARVVLKILAPHLGKREEIVQRFIREARTGKEMNHPNVVQTLGAARQGQLYFIISEYVGGRNMQDMLDEKGESGTLDPALVLDIMLQIGHALEHASRHNIVHRDIKPANIIVADDGTAKLDNLWLAKQVEEDPGGGDLTTAGVALGTLGYMAPEQLADARSVDCRADIYSLAATIYRALTGQAPCKGASVAETMRMIRDEMPRPIVEFREDIPAAVTKPIMKALSKDPNDRHAAPKELVVELELARRYQVKPKE